MFSAGFTDPVHQAQGSFRAILDALARPGTTHRLSVPEVSGSHIGSELVSVLLTLSDHDTPIWLSPELGREETRQFIGFHTGAPIVDEPAKAMFVFVAGQLTPLDQFNLGTQEYPDRSTTVVCAVPSLDGGPQLVLRGPGIEHHRHIGPKGLPDDFIAQWTANRALFPRGVDLLLVAGGQVMGLPRTVRIEEAN
jgi:alpha-D-ribose 1-methylphosphonate 5-triphosphate synthase subunit PhnH